MLYVVREALATYRNEGDWKSLMKKAATTDFSWDYSAQKYKKLYVDTLALMQ
jgi:glycogen synthase